jgi:hypothetical protein
MWSAALLILIVLTYGGRWVACHAGFLADPALQNDDARTALFPFHQYADNPAFAADPIAREMMAYVSPGIWLLYRVLVPIAGIYAASKWVQALALAVLLFAGFILARSRRGGFASGLLLVYLVLSDPYAVGRIAGGHARAFAFPCFALWVAGVVSARRWVRFSAPIVAALFYPAVTLMILAGEAFYAGLGLLHLRWGQARSRLRDAAVVIALGVLFSLPSAIGGDRTRGPIHTLAQAKHEPAFYRDGRLWVLPFGEPVNELGTAFLARFSPSGKRLLKLTPDNPSAAALTALLFVSVVFILQRRIQNKRLITHAAFIPEYVWAFLGGALGLYFAARWLAFRLYSTERYYAYGMRMFAILLVVALCAKFRPRFAWSRRVAQSGYAAVFIGLSWLCLGDGIIGNNGMTIDARWDADVYRFVRTLPKTCRFASHPMDGDGVPYFAARATIGTFETLQPWFVDSWRRQVTREHATLDALYATDLGAVTAYARKFKVDYLLLNTERYQSDWSAHMASFEPFSSYTRIRAQDDTPPALARVPAAAVIFERSPWKIVDMTRLESAL